MYIIRVRILNVKHDFCNMIWMRALWEWRMGPRRRFGGTSWKIIAGSVKRRHDLYASSSVALVYYNVYIIHIVWIINIFLHIIIFSDFLLNELPGGGGSRVQPDWLIAHLIDSNTQLQRVYAFYDAAPAAV